MVDGRGVVVGVSVSRIKGTQLNFAVPGEKIHGMLSWPGAGNDVGRSLFAR